MTDPLTQVMRQRGKVVALLVLCATLVALVHPSTVGAIFPGVSLAVGALASMEAWSATRSPADTSPSSTPQPAAGDPSS